MIYCLLIILGLGIISGLILVGASIQANDYGGAFATFITLIIGGVLFILLLKEVAQKQIKTRVPAEIEYQIIEKHTNSEIQRDTIYIYHFK